MTRVAIVGAGYAGMAAAVTLAQHGVQVTVFEAAQTLGGRARHVEYRDVALDNGLHILIGAYTETLRLIELVNPAYRQALLRLPLEWKIENEFDLRVPRLPAPLHLLIGLARAHGLNAGEKLSIIRFLSALRAARFTLDGDDTVETLLARHGQSEKVRRVLWRPLCVAALNTPTPVASAQIFANVLRDTLNGARAASDLLIARIDLSALFPEPAANFVENHEGKVLRGRRVLAIDQVEGAFEIVTASGRERFSDVICAVAPHQVKGLTAGLPAMTPLTPLIEALNYQPIHSVWLQYPGEVTLPAPMLGLTGGLIHWVFDRNALCAQRGLVGAVISAEGEHQALTQEALGIAVHRELQSHIGALPDPQWTRVIAEKRATFSCTPDVQRPSQRTPLAGLHLAGDYTASDYPATIEAAVRSGIACAGNVLSRTA